MNRRILRTAAAVLGIIAIAVGIWALLRPPPIVEIVRPQRREVVELVVASGRLRAVRSSEIGAEVSGTVASVLVDEGDEVVKGNIIITLDREAAEQQVRQAELAVETAQREYERIAAGPQQAEIARARAQVAEARRVNQARLEAAQQRLRDLETGGRPEERRRAEAELRRARAAREQAETDLRRTRQLVERGAVAEAELDRAQTTLKSAQAAEAAAEQQLELAIRPSSPEQIEQARADVRAARATLEEAVRIAQESLNALLNQPRPEELRVALSRLKESRAALSYAREQLQKRIIRAPVSGIVTDRSVEPGQSVTPGQKLMTIADWSRTEIYVETDETNLPKLNVGQKATVIAPAYQKRPFKAVLTQIGPEVDTERGVVGLKLKPMTLPDYARPDMTVDVSIEVGRYPNALAVPVSSVLQEEDRSYVLVVENGRARRKDIELLGKSTEWAAVKDISPRAEVIVQGADVTAGQAVRVRRSGD